ncbi:MAG: hypothetical protein COA79_01895 [Planctomycetota bacterium]|nr:MAG: hypothetical protein COA79_01895 [Planctomycetota bacterium]
MHAKLRFENSEIEGCISASLIADHKAKKVAKKETDSMVKAYSIVYGEIFDEAMENPLILIDWLKSEVLYENISENIEVVKGEFPKKLNWSDINIVFEKATE